MKRSNKTLVQIRRSILYALAIFIVTSAVALSIARVILPQVEGYREGIQAKLGVLIGQSVTIDAIDARLVGLTPTLIFKGVHLIDEAGKQELISFKEAHLGISVLESISQKTFVPSDFSVVGTTISVIQDAAGNISVQGFDVSKLGDSKGMDAQISEELAQWLMEQASIGVRESTVILRLRNDSNTYRFENVNLMLHNRGERHQLNSSLQLPASAGNQLELAIDVTGDLLKPNTWQGLVYVSSDELLLSAFDINPRFQNLRVEDGLSAFSLWGEFDKGGLSSLAGEVLLSNAVITNTEQKRRSKIDRLKTRFDWSGKADDWELKLDGFEFTRGNSVWRESAMSVSWQQDKQANTDLGLHIAYAKIQDVKALFLESGLYKDKYVELLRQANPQGEVRNLIIHVVSDAKGSEKYQFNAELTNLGIEATDKYPGVYGLNAYLNFDQDYGQLSLSGENVFFSHPRLFRQAIPFTSLSSKLDIQLTSNGWSINADDIQAHNPDFGLQGGMMMFLPSKGIGKYIDVQVAIKDVNLTRVHRYQPTVLMKEKLVKWVDESFLAGRFDSVNVAYRGWSKQFPFKQYTGVLRGDFQASGVNMHYFPGWPALEQMSGYGEFDNKGMLVRSNQASMHGGVIKNLQVDVEDFTRPILVAKGDAYSSTHDGFHFFFKTPPGKRTRRFVSKSIFKGQIHTNVTFSVALDKELAKKYKKRFNGYVETDNSELHLMHNRLDVREIKGRFYFSDKKHHAEGVTAKMLGGASEIWIDSKIVGVKPVATIHGKGSFDAVMLDRNFKKLGLMRIYGRVPWEGALTLGHQKSVNSDAREPAKMWLKSDLVGVEIDLPEPYKKPAEIARPTVMRSTFLPEIKTILNVQYGDRMSTEMRLNNNYFPARIEIGEMKLSAGKAKLPNKDEFRISGVVSNVDQYKWREVMQEHYNKYRKLRKRPIVDVPVMVDLAYVSVPFDKDKAKPRKRYTSPIIMPAFKGQIKEFVFAGKKIGKVEFDSRKDKLGLAFDKIRVSSPEMEYNGTMTWHYIKNWHKTKAKGRFTFHNMGELVKNFGFPDKMEEGSGEIDIDLNWNNPFYVFRLGYTDGKVKLNLEDGVVTAINPGAGRFLGILNISTLPRRLLMDFKDAGSGFAFDSLTGTIELKGGIARTGDLAVDSTIADVLAVGKVELRKKEFDQIITVTPQIAGTMPVVSGLLMGTGVIPVVWLFERIFGSDMDKALSRQYHVSGPWAKPVVERIDKEADEEN